MGWACPILMLRYWDSRQDQLIIDVLKFWFGFLITQFGIIVYYIVFREHQHNQPKFSLVIPLLESE